MKRLILSLCVCCSFASLASSDELQAYNGCHMAELRCENARRECFNAQARAMGNRIDNLRNAPVEPYAHREAYRNQEEAKRVCANANSICSQTHSICAAEDAAKRRAEQEKERQRQAEQERERQQRKRGL